MPEAPAIASLPPETAAAAVAAAKSLQLCPTVCDPIDGSLRGSPYEALPPGYLAEGVFPGMYPLNAFPALFYMHIQCFWKLSSGY